AAAESGRVHRPGDAVPRQAVEVGQEVDVLAVAIEDGRVEQRFAQNDDDVGLLPVPGDNGLVALLDFVVERTHQRQRGGHIRLVVLAAVAQVEQGQLADQARVFGGGGG